MNLGGASRPRPAAAYRETLGWLFGTQLFGIKLGLESIERLLRELNLPARDQRIIHVAGTNGKGSVCAMIDSICRASGYRSGLFTSPHLVTYRERIQVNGCMISQSQVAGGLTIIRELVRDWEPHPTFFEITTALALQHFKEEQCDVIVLETGMGGRLDATNAIMPVVSAITPIDYDHQKWLGNSLAEIAAEKAGIIKAGVPVVSAEQPPEAEAILRAKAAGCGAPLNFVTSRYDAASISLSGAHQKQNAAVAVAAIEAAQLELQDRTIAQGLEDVRWPARFQRWDDGIVIDGSHNPAGARVLAQTWREAFNDEPAVVILAVLQDKDARGIIRALSAVARDFVLPVARSERAIPPTELATIAQAAAPNLPVTILPSLTAALAHARSTGRPILITGSLHFAGEALAALNGDPDEVEDCLQ